MAGLVEVESKCPIIALAVLVAASTWKAEPAEVNAICWLPLLSVTALAWILAVRRLLETLVPALPAAWMAEFNLSATVFVVSEVVSVTEILSGGETGAREFEGRLTAIRGSRSRCSQCWCSKQWRDWCPWPVLAVNSEVRRPRALESTTEFASCSVDHSVSGVG